MKTIIIDGIEYNLTPKVLFKKGDFVVIQETTYQITEVENLNVTLSLNGRECLFDIDVLKNARLWDITKDAKDGDVLVCESGWTCIFKTLVNDEAFSSYCFMDKTKWFCETGSEGHTLNKEFMEAYNGEIKPATKEQRDTLFAKMHEAGYMWDSESKQLLFLKAEPRYTQNPAWSEEDDMMIEETLYFLREYQQSNRCKDESGMQNSVSCEKWLKSLKERLS